MRNLYLLFFITLLALGVGCQTAPEETLEEPIELPEELPPQGFEVNNEFISQEQIDDIVAQHRAEGSDMSEAEIRQYLIETTVLLQEAQRRGISVRTEEIQEYYPRDLPFLAALTDQQYESFIEQQRQERIFLLLGMQLVERPEQKLIDDVRMTYEEGLLEMGYSEEEIEEQILMYLMRDFAMLEVYALQQELLETANVVAYP